MTPEQWDRAKEIFDAALDLPLDQRSAYVHSTCSKEPTIFNEVQSLLAANDEVGSSFLKPEWFGPPLPPTPALRPGDVVSGRFRIVRPLGDGGMGEVYEAHDSELGVQIALKTLRPEIAANPEVLGRFRQEVRIAHRITHPNVCRTFQFDREVGHTSSDGSDPVDLTFITMEFLDGETLQQVLKRTGRLAPERAYAIATQMAEAIEAAHHTGIIHRDIKPGNVMICPGRNGEQDRVVVTDFGLAKIDLAAAGANPELSAISHPGHAMGTLPYMAPEQLEVGNVTAATDIYAFGLVLFEMVTGEKAFPNANTLTIAFRRLTEDPPSPRVLVPALPAEWEAAIVGCLQIDPSARFQRASDVVAVLEGASPAELRKSSRSHPSSRATWTSVRRRSKVRRRWMVAGAAAVLLCVSLSWPAYRLYQWRANSTVAPGTLVYLAPVKNETGEKQLDNITELVRAGLSQSSHINLLDAGRVSEILQHMTKPPDTAITPEIAREIAMRGNAPRIVLATITNSAENYRLNIDIQQPDQNNPSRPRENWPAHFDWSSNSSAPSGTMSPQMIVALRNATDWIRVTVGEAPKDILSLNESPEDATTNNWQAFSAFAQAEKFDSQHKKAEAAMSLQDAVRIDPHFSLAYARLGDILFSINRDAEGIEAYRHALDSSTERALSRKELDRVQGMFAIDSLDYETAIQAFRDYAAFYPNDYIGWAYPTSALRALKLDEQAVTNLRRAVELEPHRSFPLVALADELIITGHSDEALHWIEDLRKNGYDAAAIEMTATVQFLDFDFAGANATLEKLKHTADNSRRNRSYRTQLRIAAELGNFPQALKLANESIEENIAHGERVTKAAGLLDRASLECQMKDVPPCLADVREALSLDPGRRAFIAAEDILGPAVASASGQHTLAVRQEIHALEAQTNQIDFGFVTRLIRLRAHAESLIADGKLAAGLAAMRKVAALDAPATTHAYLGRVLVQAANVERSPEGSKALLEEALKAYAITALQPQSAWDDPVDFSPGFVASETEAYLHIAIKLEKFDRDTAKALTLYSHLRPYSLNTSSEFQQALRRVA